MNRNRGNTNGKNGGNGGGKGKRKKVVNTSASNASSSNNKSNRRDNQSNKRNNINNNTVSNMKNSSKNRSKKGQAGVDNDEDTPYNQNSVPSTSEINYKASIRNGQKYEDRKDRGSRLGSNAASSALNGQLSEGWYYLKDSYDEEQYTFQYATQNSKVSPYEAKQLYSLGLDLSDNQRLLCETFKSPFYKYYDECKSESLPKVDYTADFTEKTDVLHQSAAELTRWGWSYNVQTQKWYRKARSNAPRPVGRRERKPNNDHSSTKPDLFEIEFWRTTEDQLVESED